MDNCEVLNDVIFTIAAVYMFMHSFNYISLVRYAKAVTISLALYSNMYINYFENARINSSIVERLLFFSKVIRYFKIFCGLWLKIQRSEIAPFIPSILKE